MVYTAAVSPYFTALHAPLVGSVAAVLVYPGAANVTLGSIIYVLEASGETIAVPATR